MKNEKSKKPPDKCQRCKRKTSVLFLDSGKMVCCPCKYGEPLRPDSLKWPTVCSSAPHRPDLDFHDKHDR